MSLLKEAGVPTPKFGIAETAAEARKIAEDLGTKDLVIKAQVKLFNLGFHAKKLTNFPTGTCGWSWQRQVFQVP